MGKLLATFEHDVRRFPPGCLIAPNCDVAVWSSFDATARRLGYMATLDCALVINLSEGGSSMNMNNYALVLIPCIRHGVSGKFSGLGWIRVDSLERVR